MSLVGLLNRYLEPQSTLAILMTIKEKSGKMNRLFKQESSRIY